MPGIHTCSVTGFQPPSSSPPRPGCAALGESGRNLRNDPAPFPVCFRTQTPPPRPLPKVIIKAIKVHYFTHPHIYAVLLSLICDLKKKTCRERVLKCRTVSKKVIYHLPASVGALSANSFSAFIMQSAYYLHINQAVDHERVASPPNAALSQEEDSVIIIHQCYDVVIDYNIFLLPLGSPHC